jgi:hypothetical protein
MNLNNLLCYTLVSNFTLTYKCIFFKLCTQNFTDGEKLKIVSMDCDDDFIVTMSIDWYDRPGTSVSTILIRELKSGEVVCLS